MSIIFFISRFVNVQLNRPMHVAYGYTLFDTMKSEEFQDYVHRQRCLVPANAYYEWPNTGAKKKPKFEFQPVDESQDTFWMAGIYRQVEEGTLPVFTVMTMDASESVAPLHDRMPVILPSKEARRIWMSGERDFLGLFRDTAVRDIRYRPCGVQQVGLDAV